MPTALVTGAAGFIGSHLAEELLTRGYTVRGMDNFATGRRSNLSPFVEHDDFEFREGDIRDGDLLAELTQDVDYIFHEAAVASVPRSIEEPAYTTDVNCTGTAKILEVAKDFGVDTVVVASSSAVYGSGGELPKKESMGARPESPYALSKHYAEELTVEFSEFYDLDTVALRYFNIFGPRQDPQGEYAAAIPKFIGLMLDGERPTIYGDGEQSRDFAFVDNVVEANVLAAESDVTGEIFNVGTGHRVTVNELVDKLNDILDTDIDPDHDEPRPGDIRHSYADISKASELLDYEPTVGFDEGLRRTVEFFRENAQFD